MRIAESYFQTLLRRTPAHEAVQALANDWSLRAEPNSDRMNLAVPEYQTTLCLIYSGEVGNGGHDQFFRNRAGRYLPDTCAALAAAGLPEAHAILVEACQLFPLGIVPDARDEVEHFLDACSEHVHQALASLDNRIWNISFEDALIEFLRQHSDALLRPERGLAPGP